MRDGSRVPPADLSAVENGRLAVRDLTIAAHDSGGILVSGVAFSVVPGETVALVGESGSGKSLTILAMLGLLPGGVVQTAGDVRLGGSDITGFAGDSIRLRGRVIAAIFQDPQASLDPRWTVGRYLRDQLFRHRRLRGAAADREAAALLDGVGLPQPERLMKSYPHELSGGMAQRVMIAGALAARPRFLLADEPTTALDVTTQAQILDLLADLQKREGLGVLLVTHDLGVVAEIAHRVVVLYGGRIMETGDAARVLGHPRHPYTAALLAAMPDIADDMPPVAIPGHPGERPASGCPFHPRCGLATSVCETAPPSLREIGPEQGVACYHPLPSAAVTQGLIRYAVG
ncbi:ABC transporter ATP-binding protein [Pseudochelatococcus lubricantis]|uniref:ABC transporter ATP-binding protein n=1 Tax=Pseudochelatococcus lubricantis TaxID=1538102 RepID=UPI00366F5D6F